MGTECFFKIFHQELPPKWDRNFPRHHGFVPLEGAAGNVAERLKERFGAFGATLGNERELEELNRRFFFWLFFASFYKEFGRGFPKITSKNRQKSTEQDSEIFEKRENLSDRGSLFDTLDGRIPGQTAGAWRIRGPQASRGFLVMFISPLGTLPFSCFFLFFEKPAKSWVL